ncbi:hypothetical protein CXF85_17730 [Colwellia sp. 75C3]|uniref:lipopolysaccharide biosynthesis protein n=1 Tax=Colwellia sp. 75C3 TaxID=888425 RepID=UPI000C333534|nr:lipopolysaccharide biosynthesis protein [Colwellia sp. 75C3]PKG81318.1 hypothetical protein CXF85_17730 [Colwellia sp. 75C3]
MTKVRRALKFSIIATHLDSLLNLIAVIIIARILTPDELGIFAIASSIVIIANTLKTFGVGNYIVKKVELNKNDIKSALGLNIIISVTLGLIVAFSAYPAQAFYEKDDIGLLMLILTVPFFVSPYAANGIALLTRDLKFDKIFRIGIITQISNLIMTIVLVYLGFSYYALAISMAVQSIIQTFLIRVYSPASMEWLPRFKEMKNIAKFGFYVTFSNLCNKMNMISPDLIIGKVGTPSMVAYYSRGLGLINYIHTTLAMGVMQVALPYFTNSKKDGTPIEDAYLKSTALINGLLLPAFVIASVISEPLVLFIFGDQWTESAGLVATLCFWAFFNNIHPLVSVLLIAEDKEKHIFIINLIFTIITALTIFFVFPFGLNAIAQAMIVVSFVYFITINVVLSIYMKFSTLKFIRSQIKNILLCVGCYVIATGITKIDLFIETSILIQMLVFLLLMGITWLSIIFMIKHPLQQEFKKVFSGSH